LAIQRTTQGGVSGDHPVLEGNAAKVAPATGGETNSIATFLIPVGCWRVEDMRFAFDSSFVLPGIAAEMPLLADLREKHTIRLKGATPGAEILSPPPLSLFGHADPVGNDDYNKQLSGRRAMAIYALLIRDTAMWEKLFSHGFSGDNWGDPALQTMLTTNDPTLAADPGRLDQETRKAKEDAGNRTALYSQYMDKLAGTFKLARSDFLGAGADATGKADYQGCSEFNPVLLFSKEEEQEFQKSENKDQRDSENGPNRRVMGLLFRPGTEVNTAKWPCPRAEEGPAGCRARFWSDGETRRGKHLSGLRRKFEDTHDTFACRFYHRLASTSPCENLLPRLPATLEIILDNDNNLAVDSGEPLAQFVRIGLWDHGWDPATGNLLNASADAQNFISKDSVGKEARRFYFRVTDPNASGQAEVRVDWRTELGSGGNDDAPASQVISLTPTADPKVFVSRAVFLVADTVDQAQATDSGLPAANPEAGSRTAGQSNHRIRKITVDDTHQLDSNLVAEYSSILGGGNVKTTVPLFKRAPDERLKIKVHLVNVLTTAGGATGALTAARKVVAIDTLHEVYACTGIFLEVDEIVIDPPAACIGWRTRYPTSPLAIGADPAVESPSSSGGNLVPSASQLAIINVIRARRDFDANDIYLVYVTKIFANPVPPPPGGPGALLTLGSGGVAFPDSFTAANSPARSFAFLGIQTVNQFADPHEMTHVTTNLRNSAGGHFHLEATVNTGPGNIDGRNLMHRFPLIANSNTANSKRLWDEDFTNNNLSPAKIPAQITAIRASRFVRKLVT
jgi:hypothetical protein